MNATPFVLAYRGRFCGILHWPDLDAFWDRVLGRADAGWYLYCTGEAPPQTPSDARQVRRFVAGIDALLRREHRERSCGIVYADSRDEPGFIKIFDPHHLGSSCGSAGVSAPMPGWIMSLIPPEPLAGARPPSGNRRRFWRELFDSAE